MKWFCKPPLPRDNWKCSKSAALGTLQTNVTLVMLNNQNVTQVVFFKKKAEDHDHKLKLQLKFFSGGFSCKHTTTAHTSVINR